MPRKIPDKVRDIYLFPIGGTLAAPLTGLLLSKGYRVSGSDEGVYGPMKVLLDDIGIEPLRGFRAENIPEAPDLVVIGNAVPRTNPEAAEVLRRDLPYTSMPEALAGLILQGRHPVVVAGTHGKTTTTTLTAALLDHAGLDPGFLIGGLPMGFPRSFRLGAGEPFVIEGDEYNTAFFDRGAKFLHYRPQTAIVTSIEFDHGDIYPDIEAIEAQFQEFVSKLPPEGRLVACSDDERVVAICRGHAGLVTYGTGGDADFLARDIHAVRRGATSGGAVHGGAVHGGTVGGEAASEGVVREGMEFTLFASGVDVGRFMVPLAGRHNVQNSLAAVAVARGFGIPFEELRVGLASFQGVRRRMEERGDLRGILVVDDFAHHPTAVRETLDGARSRYPGRRLVCCFEPRSLTSGRRRFQDAYLEAFRRADAVRIAPIHYAKRLKPGERIDFESVATRLSKLGIEAQAASSMPGFVDSLVDLARPGDLLLFMSSGSFDGAIEETIDRLAARGDAPASNPSPSDFK